jgi:hypothetical protein
MCNLGNGTDRNLIIMQPEALAYGTALSECLGVDSIVKHFRFAGNSLQMSTIRHFKLRAEQDLARGEASQVPIFYVEGIVDVQNNRNAQHPGSQDQVRVPDKAVCMQQIYPPTFQELRLSVDGR